MNSRKGFPRPIKRESRPAGTERLSIFCQLCRDMIENNILKLRSQCSVREFGLISYRACLVADLNVVLEDL